MEWSEYTTEGQPYTREYNKLRLYRLFKTTYTIEPYLVIMENSQLRKSLCRFRIGCYQQKIETGRYQHPAPPLTERTLQAVHSWLCGERDPFLNWIPKVHAFERLYREVITIDSDLIWFDLICFYWCFTVQNIKGMDVVVMIKADVLKVHH